MPTVLVSLSEIVATLEALPKIDVAGAPHIEAGAFIRAMRGLHPTDAPSKGAFEEMATRVANGMLDETEAVEFVPPTSVADLALEAERARLSLLPPGPCVCSTRFVPYPDDPRHDPDLHVHPGADCTACADTTNACSAEDYVDTTIRDPLEAQREANPWGTAANAEPIPPHPHVEPVFDPESRPASNANAFRPPSG